MKEPITTIYLPRVEEVYLHFIQQVSYRDKDFVGKLGRMDMLKIVGHKFRPEPPPDKFEGSVELHPEPTNKHDPRAIQVIYRGKCIGYVAKNQVEQLHKMWDEFDQTGESADSPKVLNASNVYSLYLCDLPI